MSRQLGSLVALFLYATIVPGCGHRIAASKDPNGEWVPIYETAARAQTNINRLQLGMTKDEVVAVMGTKTHYGKQPHRQPTVTPHPYKREVAVQNGKHYEILYYYTKHIRGDAALTPVILIEGKVIGWGRTSLRSTFSVSE